MLRLLLALLVLLALGCPRYDGPPEAALVGIVDGILSDPTAPLVLAFHEPVDPKTLRVRVVRYETDPEGELLPDLEPIFRHDPSEFEDVGGLGYFDESKKYFTIETTETFPIGPQLALVIEPGLADVDGNAWTVPTILKFGFQFQCGSGETQPATLRDGIYFMLADVEEPIQTQLQLFIDMRVNPETGEWTGQFTNADRDPTIDCSAFGLSCNPEEEVCRTLPAPACVAPSLKAATVAEHVDYFPNSTPPIGYSFNGLGCAVDVEENRWGATNAPTDVKVESPDITVKGITFNLELTLGDDGLIVGGGTFTAQQVFLTVNPSGTGAGTVVMTEVPADQLPDGIPPPPNAP